jgi:tight adherence protein C
MTGSGLLYIGIAAFVLAVVALAASLVPSRHAQRGVSQALATIERRYSRDLSTRARSGGGHFRLPEWLPDMSVRLSRSSARPSLQRRLDIAGNRPGWTPDRILATKAVLLVVCGAVGAAFALGHAVLVVLFAGGVAAALGFFLPDVLLYNAGLKRQQQLALSLPEGLDLLTICVEAGLGFDAALAQVARNLRGPLANEFARVLQEMQIGKSRVEAMRAMAERSSVPELRSFVSALTQSAELGIPVANVLREQAKEMRVRRRQRAEAQAQKVPVKITFPLIGCLLPALFIIVLGAGFIEIAHTLLHEFR